jgi:hypothetical protein
MLRMGTSAGRPRICMADCPVNRVNYSTAADVQPGARCGSGAARRTDPGLA